MKMEFVAVISLWIPLAGTITSALWYIDGKEINVPYIAEIRFGIGLSGGVPAFFLALCRFLTLSII